MKIEKTLVRDCKKIVRDNFQESQKLLQQATEAIREVLDRPVKSPEIQ